MIEDIKQHGQNSEYIDVTDPQEMNTPCEDEWFAKRNEESNEHQDNEVENKSPF